MITFLPQKIDLAVAAARRGDNVLCFFAMYLGMLSSVHVIFPPAEYITVMSG